MKVQGKAVLLLPDENPEKVGSVIVPRTAKKLMAQAIVIDVGPAVKEVKVGDHVDYRPGRASIIEIDGKVHHFVTEDLINYII